MLFKLKKITADYYGVLSKLRRLRELADTLGEIGTDLRKDAERAENQCNRSLDFALMSIGCSYETI